MLGMVRKGAHLGMLMGGEDLVGVAISSRGGAELSFFRIWLFRGFVYWYTNYLQGLGAIFY